MRGGISSGFSSQSTFSSAEASGNHTVMLTASPGGFFIVKSACTSATIENQIGWVCSPYACGFN
jgi:hypothetical protein